MTFFKRFDNFWFYYKTHILVGIFIIAAAVPLVVFDKDQKPAALQVSLIGNAISPINQEKLQNEAAAIILGKDAKSEVRLNFWQVDGQIRSMSNIDLYQKLLAQIGVKEIDVLLLEKSDFDLMVKEDAFMELNNILGNDGIRVDNEFGINVTGNPILSNAGYHTENKIVCILKNTKHKETAVRFVDWLVKQ